MQNGFPREVVHIKKYPNRRYYDATRSRHVTLQDVYELIVGGTDVVITDSRDNEDITNLVLTQIILEHDEPKLNLFPSAMLHLMIRSNRNVVRQWFEQFFGPFAGVLNSSQRQLDAFLRQAMTPGIPNPLKWANDMMSAFTPGASTPPQEPPHDDGSPPDEPANENELDELRRKLAELSAKFDELSGDRPAKPASPPHI